MGGSESRERRQRVERAEAPRRFRLAVGLVSFAVFVAVYTLFVPSSVIPWLHHHTVWAWIATVGFAAICSDLVSAQLWAWRRRRLRSGRYQPPTRTAPVPFLK